MNPAFGSGSTLLGGAQGVTNAMKTGQSPLNQVSPSSVAYNPGLQVPGNPPMPNRTPMAQMAHLNPYQQYLLAGNTNGSTRYPATPAGVAAAGGSPSQNPAMQQALQMQQGQQGAPSVPNMGFGVGQNPVQQAGQAMGKVLSPFEQEANMILSALTKHLGTLNKHREQGLR